MRLEPELGGRSRVTEDRYLEGAPELAPEIAASSASYDPHAKLRVHQRSGVEECIVAQMYERRIDCFACARESTSLCSPMPRADSVVTSFPDSA